jgi:hypothetical protein
MKATNLFHVGIVVPSLDPAMARLEDLLAIRWGDVMESETPVRDPLSGDERTVAMRIVYSIEAPHLELIEEVPGTVWTCNEHSNLHHIGFWSDSLGDESARLAGLRCPLEITGWLEGSEPPQMYAYHNDALGFRVELVSSELREAMEGGCITG